MATDSETVDVWPASRNPTRDDVDDANQLPTATQHLQFRSALMHGESEDVVQNAACWDLDAYLDRTPTGADPQPYTYPMVLLAGLRGLPPDHELASLRLVYLKTFATHVYIKDAAIESITAHPIPPYLQLAMACIGSVFSPRTASIVDPTASEQLFLAGVDVWSVMLEVDNREARNAKAVAAAILLATYGILGFGASVKRKTAVILSSVVTITRRLRLTNASPSAYTSLSDTDRDLAGKSALLCYSLLVDTLHALNSNTTPNYSIAELSSRMPQTKHSFQAVYNALLHGHAMPDDLDHRDDALALAVALLSNIIQTHNTYPQVLTQLFPSDPWNPYRPLRWTSELAYAIAVFNAALTRWETCFLQKAEHDVIALHHYTRLHLLVPSIAEFPGLARHRAKQLSQPECQGRITDEALESAWKVFEHADYASKEDDQRMSIWLPQILFLSALVVWRHHWDAQPGHKYGSLRSLSMYQTVLLQLPWHCCTEMAALLDSLGKER